MTQRVTVRTLVLVLELLAAVVGFQWMAAGPTKADAVWLAGDCITAARPAAQPVDRVLIP